MNTKRKLVLTGLLGFTFLFGCSQVDNGEVSATDNLPESFSVVAKTKNKEATYYEVKHLVTNCHYMYTDGGYSGGITQMFIEKDGKTVPYCDKTGGE